MREFVVELTPELAEVLKSLTPPKSKENKPKDVERTDAISGERVEPRRALRRGLQPQK